METRWLTLAKPAQRHFRKDESGNSDQIRLPAAWSPVSRRNTLMCYLYVTGQSLPEDISSASELYNWFGLNFDLCYI